MPWHRNLAGEDDLVFAFWCANHQLAGRRNIGCGAGEQAIRTLCADLPSDADTKFPVILHDARYLVVPVKLKQRLEFVENSSQ